MSKKQKNISIKSNKYHNNITKSTILPASLIVERIKAFIVDMFMIMMPILYITTYLLMDGKDDFQNSELARWSTAILFGLIIILLTKIKGQTLGLKAYELKVVDSETLQNITFLQSTFRYILFILSAVSIIGLFLPFFREDRKTIYDLLTHTTVISTETN